MFEITVGIKSWVLQNFSTKEAYKDVQFILENGLYLFLAAGSW
jgi:hypothetical protein